jgi:hypothetical protein
LVPYEVQDQELAFVQHSTEAKELVGFLATERDDPSEE